MATVNSVTYNAGSTGTDGVYNPGDPVTATVNYTPDTPAVTINPVTETATTTITNAAGEQTATFSSTFVVNEQVTNSAGDTVAESDSGSHTWAEGTQVAQSDGTITVPFTTSA